MCMCTCTSANGLMCVYVHLHVQYIISVSVYAYVHVHRIVFHSLFGPKLSCVSCIYRIVHGVSVGGLGSGGSAVGTFVAATATSFLTHAYSSEEDIDPKASQTSHSVSSYTVCV